MGHVTGIGGFFFRAKDPLELARWYEANLGVRVFPATDEWWMQEAGPTVLAPFDLDTDYFGRAEQQAMVNFRVRDLDAIREQLQAGGARVSEEIREVAYGRFCWAADPEGNRFELWEPSADLGSAVAG
ncbi:MAG: glyoxalase [Candidatus Rokuibacteriota bacterium]|nr:MAG: glyoxalase [Candidatus Rokubacteria bacterium]